MPDNKFDSPTPTGDAAESWLRGIRNHAQKASSQIPKQEPQVPQVIGEKELESDGAEFFRRSHVLLTTAEGLPIKPSEIYEENAVRLGENLLVNAQENDDVNYHRLYIKCVTNDIRRSHERVDAPNH